MVVDNVAELGRPQSLLANGRNCELSNVVEGQCETNEPRSVMREIYFLISIGAPLAVSQSAKIIQDLSTAILLGRFQTDVLAAVAVSTIWTSLFDIMFFSGLGQLSTLCSNAIGAGNKPLAGTYLQIFLVFATLGAIPVFVFRWFTCDILVAWGINAELATLGGKFAVWSQGAFVCDIWYFAVKEYYAAQLIVYPDAVVDGVFIFVNIGMVHLFVYVLEWGEDGIVGAAAATTLTRFSRLWVYVLYCWCRGYHKETWTGWSWREIAVRQRWQQLFVLVLPAAVGGLAEELQFELCALLSARMGAVKAATLNLSLNMVFIFFVFSMSMGEATGIRMGRLLGKGDVVAAKFASDIGIASTFAASIVIGIVVAMTFKWFALLASRDEAVQEQLVELRWCAALVIGLLGSFMPLASVLTKQGRAGILGGVIAVTCWCIGFPVSFFRSASHGLVGIYDGLLAGYGLALLVLYAAYRFSDWPKLVLQARERAEAEEIA